MKYSCRAMDGYLSGESVLELTYVGNNKDGGDNNTKTFTYDDLILESWNTHHQH